MVKDITDINIEKIDNIYIFKWFSESGDGKFACSDLASVVAHIKKAFK